MDVALPSLTVQCSEILIIASLPGRPKFKRHHTLVRSKENVVAEPPAVEYVRQIGQHFIAEERCSRMHAAPGEIVRRRGREVWMQVRRKIGEAAPYASLVVGVYHSLTLPTCGLVNHDDVPSRLGLIDLRFRAK